MNIKLGRLFLLFAITSFNQPIFASKLNTEELTTSLNDYSVRYNVLRDGREYGHAIRSLKKQPNNNYILKLTTKASAFFYSIHTEQVSEFSYSKKSIKPIKYSSFDDRSFKKTSRQSIDFEKRLVSGGDEENKWVGNLQEEIFDPLLIVEVLRLNVKNKLLEMNYKVYDDGKVKDYLFISNGIDKIITTVGQLDCLKVTRVRANSSRETHIWLAKDFDFIPIKVIQENKGEEVVSLVLESIKIEP